MSTAANLIKFPVTLHSPKRSNWLGWLEHEAFEFEDMRFLCDLECNGMSWALSYLLTQSGIEHECFSGYVSRPDTNESVLPHYWIELPGGWIMDLRLRMWFGDTDCVPHGIFHRNQAILLGFMYHGEPELRDGAEYKEPFLDALTDGNIHKIRFSRPEDVLE